MATDGGDHKLYKYKIRSHARSGQSIKDMVGSMSDQSRKFSRTLEHGDGQGSKVRPGKKLSPDLKKAVKQMLHRDIEKVRKDVVYRALTLREPLGDVFQLQTDAWYWTLVVGHSSDALHILVHKEQVQWGDQVCDNRNETMKQPLLSCRLTLHAAQTTPLMVISPYGDILTRRMEYSDLPLRLSHTYGTLETKTWSSQGPVYGRCSCELTSVENNLILHPSGNVRCLHLMPQTRQESTDNAGSEQLQTKTYNTTNASKENHNYLQHEEDEHLSSDYYFATGNQTDPQKSIVRLTYGDKPKCGCSLEEKNQRKAAFITLNTTHDERATISCSRNTSSSTGFSDLSFQNINSNGNHNDKTCNKGVHRCIINNEHLESCQNSNNKLNKCRKDVGAGRDENSNKNNNSNEHHVDSDGSSDSEIDYTFEENNDNCKIGRGPETSNTAPSTGHHMNAKNIEVMHSDSHSEYFDQISMDSSANSTHFEMKHDTEASKDIVCESLMLFSDGKTCERTIYTSNSAMGEPQQAEKLGGANCESDQEFQMHSPNDKILFIGQRGVETHIEHDTHTNRAADHCSSVDISTEAEMKRVNNTTNEALQMKQDSSQIQDSYPCREASLKPERDIQERTGDSAAGSEQCLGQVFGDDFNTMSAGGIGTFSSSQEDFTENNGTLQASCLNKEIDGEGMRNTEITEPVRMLQGLCEESEILKCWEGSVHIRQTGQCCLEDVKSVNFLNMLTNRLKEYTDKDAFISSPESSATSTDETGQYQPECNASDKSLVASTPLASDHECFSFCESTGSDVCTPAPHEVTREQQRGRADTMTTEKPTEADAACVILEYPKNSSESKTHLSSEHTESTDVSEGNVLMTPTGDARAESTDDAPLETLSNCQQAEANDLCELWSTKYTISLSDEFLQKYDLLTMQSKEKYKKFLDSLKIGTNDLKRSINYQFADPAFEVDIFRSLEYATSLSCGLVSEKRSFGQVIHEQSNTRAEFHDLAAAQLKENSRNSGGSAHERETVSIKAPESEKPYSVSMSNENALCQINDEDTASYSKARMMSASERRRKLMTEFEEITSCADVYSCPRYDNRHFCYESGNFCQDFDSPLKRQANHSESAVQSEGKQRVGTFTIEYLKPPVTGFVFLK